MELSCQRLSDRLELCLGNLSEFCIGLGRDSFRLDSFKRLQYLVYVLWGGLAMWFSSGMTLEFLKVEFRTLNEISDTCALRA